MPAFDRATLRQWQRGLSLPALTSPSTLDPSDSTSISLSLIEAAWPIASSPSNRVGGRPGALIGGVAVLAIGTAFDARYVETTLREFDEILDTERAGAFRTMLGESAARRRRGAARRVERPTKKRR